MSLLPEVSMECRTDWADDVITVKLVARPFSYVLSERFKDREKVTRFWRRSLALKALEEALSNVDAMLAALELNCGE